MSVSFTWEIVHPDKRRPTFRAGTSSDIAALDATFPQRLVCSDDIRTLRAMARAAGGYGGFWVEIADKIEGLQGDSPQTVTIKIDTEF